MCILLINVQKTYRLEFFTSKDYVTKNLIHLAEYSMSSI